MKIYISGKITDTDIEHTREKFQAACQYLQEMGQEPISPTIPARARTDGSGQPVIRSSSYDNNIRRLTEIECERLQGFPDDWTKWGCYDGETKEIAKTNRYKLIGNAVTVDIVELIAKRLKFKK